MQRISALTNKTMQTEIWFDGTSYTFKSIKNAHPENPLAEYSGLTLGEAMLHTTQMWFDKYQGTKVIALPLQVL